MRTRLLFLIAGILLALASCKKSEEHAAADSEALARVIREFGNNACSGGTVTQYEFRNAQVYAFADGCVHPDNAVYVTDASGRSICTLGGIGGFTECQGVRFDSNATNPVVVYRKP